MNSVKISVIVPLYNKEAIIKETINSVLKQSFTDYEFIIIDDGSTDKSLEFVSSFEDARIKIIKKKNGGVSSARNLGAQIATGKFLFFLDADDQITEDCLFTLLNLSNDFPQAEIVTGNHISVSTCGITKPYCLEKNRGLVENPLKRFFLGDFLPRTGSTLFLRKAFVEVGGFDERILIFEDLELDLKLLKKCIFAYTPEIVYFHRLDFADLSIKPKPIDKYFSYYVHLEGKFFWEKMLIIHCVMATYYKFKDFEDKYTCDFLLTKLHGNMIYFIVYRFCQKYAQYRKHFFAIKN